jgi:2-polyprenyl-6-hydroxyphenyl methylase / 3-demethylubiquinone-9 3-methyltransferase
VTQPTPDLDRLVANEADIAFARRVTTIMRWIPPSSGTVVLDVPCGRGFYIERYRHVEPASQVVGVELDGPTVQLARTALPTSPLARAAIESLPFPDDTFDAAICSEVLEHVADDVAALAEVARVVRPGGSIAITVPHADYPFWWDPINWTLERTTGRHVSRGPLAGIWANHVRLYRRDELVDVVQRCGLELVDVRSFTHHCLPFSHNLVYGLGKPLLERRLIPAPLAAAADRHHFDETPSRWNPLAMAVRLTRWFDRRNHDDEPVGRATVSLAVHVRVPGSPS